MKLLLGITLGLAVIVVAFLLLWENGRLPNQIEVPRTAAEPTGKTDAVPEIAREKEGRQRVTLPTESEDLPGKPDPVIAPKRDPKLSIAGIILSPKGKPVSGFWISAYHMNDSGKPVRSARSDPSGQFELELMKAGQYRLKAHDQTPRRSTSILAMQPITARTGTLDLRIHLVLGKQGGFKALLTGFGMIQIPEHGLVHIKKVDEGGRYANRFQCPGGRMEINGMAPGRYKLEFFIPGMLADPPVFRVLDKQVIDLGRIWFYPPGVVAGIILDAKGKPIQGVGIIPGRGYDYSSNCSSFLRSFKPKAVTDAQGRFHTTGFRSPWIPITFAAMGYAPIELILKSTDQARTIRLRMHRSANLEISNLPPFPVTRGRSYRSMSIQLTASDLPPSYSLVKKAPLQNRGISCTVRNPKKPLLVPDLPPGLYHIQLPARWGANPSELTIRLTAGKTNKLVWK